LVKSTDRAYFSTDVVHIIDPVRHAQALYARYTVTIHVFNVGVTTNIK